MVDRLCVKTDNPVIQEVVNHIRLAKMFNEWDHEDDVYGELKSAEEKAATLSPEEREKLTGILSRLK